MKLRNPRLIRLVAYFAAKIIKVWIWTLRYTYCRLGPDVRPQIARPDERYIYTFWHENMLLLAYHYGRPNVWILISHHADGQPIAEITGKLLSCVRGSRLAAASCRTRHGRAGQSDHLAITPDAHAVLGEVSPPDLHSFARAAHVLAGTIRRCWRQSWDRFAVPPSLFSSVSLRSSSTSQSSTATPWNRTGAAPGPSPPSSKWPKTGR